MFRRIVLAAVAATLVPAPAALAAVELGQTTASGPSCTSSSLLIWQTSAAYRVPGRGVLTQLRTSSGTAGAVMSIKVVRPGTAPAILFTTAPLTITNPGDVASVDVKVPVEAGDTLGFWTAAGGNICSAPGTSADSFTGVPDSADQPVGPVAGTIAPPEGGVKLAVAARWEPDADGDGFGDDTQDGCPTDPAITAEACAADARLSAEPTPASIEVGDIAVIDLSVANPGTGIVRGAAVSAVLPPGLRGVLVTPRSCVLTGVFSCALGDFGTGSREAALVVRGTAPGTHTIAVALTTTTRDPNPANNAVSVPLTVTAPLGQACTVPRLRGQTKRFAAALLKAAGCKLGATKAKRARKGKVGRVVSQGTKAGSSVPLGTAVDVTLRKRARR
jgi:hypothetical protein